MGDHSMTVEQEIIIERWNSKYKEGQKVEVTKDMGEKIETTTRSEAWLMGGHTAMILLVGIRGGYMLERVKAI